MTTPNTLADIPLTLAEFRSTRKYVDNIDAVLGEDPTEEMYPVHSGLVYADGFWIGIDPKMSDIYGPAFYLEIENWGRQSRTLDDLEAELFSWAISAGWFRPRNHNLKP